MSEHTSDEIVARRMKIRSWRRGMKEMDLILGRFADARLDGMGAEERRAYAALLDVNDQSLFAWFSGFEPAPERHAPMLETIRAFHAP